MTVAPSLVVSSQRRARSHRWRRQPLALVGAILVGIFGLGAIVHPLLLVTVWDPGTYHPVTGYADHPVGLEVVDQIDDPARQIDIVRARLRYDPAAEIGDVVVAPLQPAPPSARHLLGTDPLGRDVLSQLLFGARTAFIVGAVAAMVAAGGGVLAAAVAAVVRGRLDAVLQRTVELALVLPALPLLILVGTLFEAGPAAIGLVVGIASGLGPTAIVLRAHALTLVAHPSVEAARVAGAGSGRIVVSHIIPGLVPLAVLAAMFTVAAAVGAEAILSLFGLVNVPMSWGVMVNLADAGGYLTHGFAYWWLLVPVGTAVTLLAAAFYLLGRGLDDIVHPRLEHPVGTVAVSRSSLNGGASSPAGTADRQRPTAAASSTCDAVRVAAVSAMPPILAVRGLDVTYRSGDDAVRAVDGVELSVAAGEVLGIAGASGSGKSTVGWAIMRLLPTSATVRADQLHLAGEDLIDCDDQAMRCLRGSRVAIVPQNALHAWNPVLTIGAQMGLVVAADHGAPSVRAMNAKIAAMLAQVELDPATANRYPHELSGGMLQRAMIAMALARDPVVLIADEPTSALDAVSQVQILELLAHLQRDRGLAMIHIAHDLAALAWTADRIAVMETGCIVDHAMTAQLVTDPQHPATGALLAAVPSLDDTVLSEPSTSTRPFQP